VAPAQVQLPGARHRRDIFDAAPRYNLRRLTNSRPSERCWLLPFRCLDPKGDDLMAARLDKTRTPGIFKRGSRYTFSYRANGKQHWESCRTLDEARRAKQARSTDIERGEYAERSRVTLHEFGREWVERYEGRGRRGYRENTRAEYRRLLDQYALRYFSERTRLTDVSPSSIAAFVAWVCSQTKPAPTTEDKTRRVPLSDKTVRNIVTPLRACLATAVREGLIRSNPARDIDLPHRPAVDGEDEEVVRAMTREELSTLLELLPSEWRTFHWLLAATGLRISEAIALQWKHLQLDGSGPHLKVRRGLVKGRMDRPKSWHGRREVPLEHALVTALRRHRKGTDWPGEEDLVFPAGNGSPLMPDNLRRRVLKPAAEEAGVPWASFHSLRHTCASLLFAEGRNAVQVQRWLGHHSAAFTLATYVHLLDGDLGEPLAVLKGANGVQTSPTPLRATATDPLRESTAV
jgi:integrase